MGTTRIAVAGGGIAGVPLAYEIKAALHGSAEVILVSDRPHFHFVPANPWLALGLRAESDVSFALEPLLAARKIGLRAQAVRTIHPDDNRLTLADGTDLAYDYLALATGIRPDWKRVPCAEPGTNVHSVIRAEDAAAAYAAYREFLHQPGPVVVAAAAGASILGPMYEYAFLLDADLRRRGLRARVPITFVTPEPYPGHLGLGKPVVREALGEALKAHDIDWVGNAAVQACHGGRLQFTAHDGPDQPAERNMDFSYAMAWPPFRGIDAVTQCERLSDEHGLIPVDDYQRSSAYANIFALGACTAKPALTRTPVPVGVPDAVYAVQQQVGVVARNIAHSLRGEPLISARIEREHWIEDMGKRGAAYLSAPQMPLRNVNWLRHGRWVFEAKRDFENYFMNQILFGASQHGQVPALVRRLGSQTHREATTATAPLGAQLPINDGVRRELEALAHHLDVSAEDLGRQLLERAVAEAASCLDPDSRQKVASEVRERLVSELEAEQERVRFEGGAP